MRLASFTVASFLAMSSTPSFAFTLQNKARNHFVLEMAAGNKSPKKKNQQKKKRRFAQDLEPETEITLPIFKQQSQMESRPPEPMDSQKNVVSTGRKPSNRNMMQSSKSIEELEEIMAKRWGTSSDKWEVNFSEWEVADEEGNESKSNKHSRQSIASGKNVRSKPVLDPWEKEEKRRSFEETKKNKKKSDDYDNTNASAFQDAKDRQDAVLNRVKRNQAKFADKTKDSSLNGDFTKSEFYDEDDEGYESSISFFDDDDDFDEETEDFYDNIISPKPVGGSGSSRSSNGGGGFFFSENKIDESPIEETESLETLQFKAKRAEKQKKQKQKKASRKQMIDEDSNELFLTLEQAQRQADHYSITSTDQECIESEYNMPSWEDIGITNTLLLQNLADMNCDSPLPVQDKACPSIVSGNDVLVSTHTGSGKTLSFLAPLAEQLLCDESNNNAGVKVIIVAPGRELASQIVAVARDLFRGTGLSATLAIGGTPFGRNFEQIRKKKPDFIIGTPGRIAELVVGKPDERGGKLKINNLQAVVLDECDALLEYEPHRDPTMAVMEVLKRRHGESLQSIFCSATAGDLMGKSLLDDLLRPGYAHAETDDDDKLVTSGESQKTRVSRTAIHGVVHVDHQRFALETLRKILYTDPAPQQVLIFVDNARRVGVVVDKLAQLGIIAAPLHGGQGSEKGDRAEVNKALREGFVGIVVATEMAARGIDAPYLTHVINLDLPTDASHYAHRAGRCGRGGRPGVVVNIAIGSREKNVPKKFADALGIDMHLVEPQEGKLCILES
ncbi:hypothetical protein CTEN210_11085 [Chaetoceros tenuissimus]|uniref:RNA helicase n=1 Tax=Chaetoceros tenuissimus TaxID=426638 RepID=A0AAD3CZ37_9STRA|nr:hypothetical protein CTEN210_11085 [Chaetoceros tenuissimus]